MFIFACIWLVDVNLPSVTSFSNLRENSTEKLSLFAFSKSTPFMSVTWCLSNLSVCGYPWIIGGWLEEHCREFHRLALPFLRSWRGRRRAIQVEITKTAYLRVF